MKFAILALTCLVAAAHAQSRASAFSSFGSFGKPSQPYRPQQPFRTQPAFKPQQPFRDPVIPAQPSVYTAARAGTYQKSDVGANILKYGNEVNPDSSYSYFFETDNGIAAQAQGTPRNFGGNPPVAPDVAQGSFSWISPEGVPIAITYVADENGYQPQGDAIPTPPPVPEAILRSLEYIARSAPRPRQ